MKAATVILACAVALKVAASPRVRADDTTSGNVPRMALLVGIERYVELPVHEQLNGCANDVAAMRQVLIERFGFAEDDIVTLTDEAATGQAVRTALDDLLNKVHGLPPEGPPAQVVFHFSGHGSQVPDQRPGDPDRDEEDGLDETLVPHDAQRQGGTQDIRDDELYDFVDRLCGSDRARLWVILDCCHSGTGVRGATRVRKLERPGAAPAKTTDSVTAKRLANGCVVLSACRATEVEPEYQDESGHYGLLTRFLVQLLLERPALSGLSYRTLQEAIVARYRDDPSIVQPPTPQLEGSRQVLDQIVLGAGEAMDRPPCWQVTVAGRDRRQALLLAGALHGVTAGSLYELASRPDAFSETPRDVAPASDVSADWLRIDKVTGTTSVGSVFRWTDAKRNRQVNASLPNDFKRGFAVQRYHDPGALGLRVRVVRASNATQDLAALEPAQAPSVIRDALLQIRQPGEVDWITWTDDNSPCDVLLRIDGGYVALFPATGLTDASRGPATRGAAIPPSLRGGWGPIELRPPSQAIAQLQGHLRRIARVRNLLRLAATKQADETSNVSVQLELLNVELDDAYRIVKSTPWSPSLQSLSMRLDDIYALRVSNHGDISDKPIFVTVVAIDPNMEIQIVLPYQEGVGLIDEQRLDGGADRITDAFLCSAPAGPRWAVALATREPNDFYILAQPALPRHRGIPTTEDSPLRSLLLHHTYFQARGDHRLRPVKVHDDTWSASVLRWNVVP